MAEQLRQQFVEYLSQAFGDEFRRLLNEPDGIQTGERVLYKTRQNATVERREASERDQEALRQQMMDFARRTGATGVTFEPPVSSRLPYPRLIDLPGSSIIWDADLRAYMNSDAPLPSEDFPLEWVLGVLHAPAENMVLYLDFTDAKVKAIFRVFYDAEQESRKEQGAEILARFKAFQSKKRELEARCQSRLNIAWAKVVQIDDEPLWIRINDMAPTSP